MAVCPKCGYEWSTKATAAWITCPGCQRKFPRQAPKVEVLGRRVPLAADCTVCGRTMAELNVCRIDREPAFICSTCLRAMEADASDES